MIRNPWGRGLGCLPDPKDERDIPLRTAMGSAIVPSAASVEDPRVEVKQQWSTSSCVGQAVSVASRLAYLFAEHYFSGPTCPDLSALFPYYLARATHGSTPIDGGTYVRAAFRAVQLYGMAAETTMPFSRWAVNRQPSFRATRDAYDRRGQRGYYRVFDADDVRRAIARGLPVVAGWQIDESFTRHTDGVIDIQRGRIVGGHAVVLVGYDRDEFRLQNSWGSGWGERGFARCNEDFVNSMQDGWAVDVRGIA